MKDQSRAEDEIGVNYVKRDFQVTRVFQESLRLYISTLHSESDTRPY